MQNNKIKIDGKVSIITPTYNSEEFILDTIRSVQNQTYTNWEMIIIDDCSTDRTVELIEKLKDSRIRVIVQDTNKGAAMARNRAIEEADGEFFAFLDSDDSWKIDKLEKQIRFMRENNYDFTSTHYEHVDKNGNSLGIITKAREKLDYNGLLKYCPGNSTVIYNAKKLGVFFIPDIKRRNDFVMWLQVIKKAKYNYGLLEPLTYYQVREGSLSSNKKTLIKYQWYVYRKIENISVVKSLYLLGHKIISVLFK